MTLDPLLRIITILILLLLLLLLLLLTHKYAASPSSYVLDRSTLNTCVCNMLKQSYTDLDRT
jgi:hypothetical protein